MVGISASALADEHLCFTRYYFLFLLLLLIVLGSGLAGGLGCLRRCRIADQQAQHEDKMTSHGLVGDSFDVDVINLARTVIENHDFVDSVKLLPTFDIVVAERRLSYR